MRSSFCLLLLCAVVSVGCSKKNQNGSGSSSGSTGGSSGGSTGSSGTSGNVDAGPTPCTTDVVCTGGLVCNAQPGGSGFCAPPCQYDDTCAAGLRCDEASGHCIAASPCDDTVISSPVDACLAVDAGYCGTRCRCETDGGAPGTGVCRRVRAYCDPCASDGQCNPCPAGVADCDFGAFVFPARCAPVGDAGTFCEQTISNQGCPFGFLPNPTTGVCEPQSHVCGGPAACQSDTDCVRTSGPGNFCEVSTGVCKPFCTFDYNSGTSVNCSPNQVCNVSPRFVLADAGFARYGAGTCGKPCDAQGGPDCRAIGATLGLTFACVTERSGEHRCRPVSEPDAGGCMNNVECAPTNDGGVYGGYCGLYQFACKYDCRDGVDPISGLPYSDHDCAPPSGSDTAYKCAGSVCVEKNCVEKGGAQFGHNNEFCCGQDRDHTGLLDSGFANTSDLANACNLGVDAGQFYLASSPPWCNVPCDPDPSHGFPDGGIAVFATCSALADVPNFDPRGAPNYCLTYAQGKATCVIAAEYLTECPRGWGFKGLNVGCGKDADCDSTLLDGGPSGTGHCNVFPDGGGKKTCACTQDEAIDGGGYIYGGGCPDLTRCGNPGSANRTCIITRGCTPNAGVCP
jgi:hypothetical protein